MHVETEEGEAEFLKTLWVCLDLAVFVSHQKLTETSVKTVRCLMAKALSQHGSRRAARALLREISVLVRFVYPKL